jgi:acyl-CoA thioester hydrolase
MTSSAHHYYLRVYYEDTDAGGVVYHASYLRFAERARTEALRDAGSPHAQMERLHGTIFMVRRIEIEYLRPARLDAWLRIATSVEHVGGASVRLRQVVSEGEDTVAVLTVGLVCVGLGDGRPARIPDRWRDVLMAGLGDLDRGSNG